MNHLSVSKKDWVLKTFDENLVQKYCEKFFFDEIVSRLLVIKNISEEKINIFLNPTIKNTMPNPNNLKDMDKAVTRTLKAIFNNEKIGIFGDYDVDGASSTALLGKFFNEINQSYEIFIPNRIKDGYGPSLDTFQKLIDKNVTIIITVDCGTMSYEPIEYAKRNKIDVIVLDHHQGETKLPNACAIVNPNRVDCESKLNYLCAAAVTFLFLVSLNKSLKKNNWYINKRFSEPNLINYLDLVCLGTICDVVPLIDFNRSIVKQGLKIISKRTNVGIKTLYDLINIQGSPSSYHIGYQLGPRINAGGRVGKSSHASNLLLANNEIKALEIARELNFYNNQRQILQNKLIHQIEKIALKEINNPVLVICGSDWHEGVLGIIAAKIKDKFHKPTILISFTGTRGKGTARSINGFDIGSVLISALNQTIIEKGGGHKMAGGFSIQKNKIDLFKEFLFKKFNKSKASTLVNNKIYIDGSISSSALNTDFFDKINILSPYGSGNKEPTFLIENVKVIKSIKIRETHLQVIFISDNKSSFKGIAFNCVDTVMEKYLSHSYKKKINIVGKLSLNEWQGRRNIEFIIEDISVIRKDN